MNAYPVDLSCEISVVQCSTCRFPHELENVYYVRALSTKLKNHPSAKETEIGVSM